MNEHRSRYARLRDTAAGALAALAAVAALSGAVALAQTPHARARTHRRPAATSNATHKAPTSPAPGKSRGSGPAVDHQPFLNAIQQLVDNGTITAAQARIVDREIVAGRVDTDTLAADGLTATQLQAINDALANAKRALGPSRPTASK